MKEQIEIPGGIITIVAGVVAFVVIALLLIYGGNTYYKNYDARKAEEKSLEDLTKRRDHLATLRDKYEDVEETKQNVIKALPNMPNDDQVINCLNNVAVTSATRITSLKFEADVQKVGYFEIPFAFSIQGNYDAITNAVYNVKLSERPFRVDSVSTILGPEGTTDMLATIKGSAFYIAGGNVPLTPSP